jgi:hypothetical protein
VCFTRRFSLQTDNLGHNYKSRDAPAPEALSNNVPLKKSEGAGNAGCQMRTRGFV